MCLCIYKLEIFPFIWNTYNKFNYSHKIYLDSLYKNEKKIYNWSTCITYCKQGSITSFVLLAGVIGLINDCGLTFCDVLGRGTLV